MKIGYIQRIDLKLNPHIKEKFKFISANATRTINNRGDKVRSKILLFPVDYEETKETADMMKQNPHLIIVCEPFILDDELKDKCEKWVEWANTADPADYDPFARMLNEEQKQTETGKTAQATGNKEGQAVQPVDSEILQHDRGV